MSKSKHSNKIVEDHDGSFYCLKCGQAGFKTKASGYGHLTTCKGYKPAVSKITKQLKELNFIQTEQDNGNHQSIEVVNVSENNVSPSLFSAFYPEGTESGPTVGHPRATLGPPSGPPRGSPRNSEPSSDKLKIMQMEAQIGLLSKLAFNHNEHYPNARPAKNFSGPMDIVGDVYGRVANDDAMFRLIKLGIIIWAGLYLYNMADKAKRNSKTYKNK